MIRFAIGFNSQLIADGTYYFAEANDGQLVGCVGWSNRQTLYVGDQAKAGVDPLLSPSTDAARIRAFVVHTDCARRGIGRRLIETCEAAALGAGFTRIELGATLPGESLYVAMGYVVIDRFDISLPDDEAIACAHMTKIPTLEIDLTTRRLWPQLRK